MENVKSIIEGIQSDKIKERQEGLNALREVFSRDSVIAAFNVKDGKARPVVWLAIFQALFSAAATEKVAITKKATSKSGTTSAAAALRRLTDTTRTIRWLLERTVHLLNKKVITALVAHMLQMLSTDRRSLSQLFQPVALDYAKSLKCILSFQPHLEHLDDSYWVQLVEASFNVVLGDPINAHFKPSEDEEANEGSEVDSDMYVDNSVLAEDSDDPIPGETPPRGTKRIRRAQTLSPRKKAKRSRIISVTVEQVEFASLLPILIGSPVAPILAGEDYLASEILDRLQRFLEMYPADSSLLHDYLTTLKHALNHLSLNKKYEVEQFARLSWDGLVGLWGTKDKRMKEDLVIVLRQLFEFIVCPEFGEGKDVPKLPQFDRIEGIGRLWQVLNGEADSKWGMEGLQLECLRLENVAKEDNGRILRNPFTAHTYRSGLNFDSNHALSWCILELQSDCAAELFKMSESMQDVLSPDRAARRDHRRFRLDSPVNSLLRSIQLASSPRALCHYLQSLLFFIDRHWSLLHNSLKQEVIDVLLQYVAYSDPAVQSWTFLNFAAVAFAEGKALGTTTTPSGDGPDVLDGAVWESIWTHAVRRANAPTTCRAACHATQTILTCLYSRSARTVLSAPRILGEIETLTKDMDVQGPSYPYDSVCIFLSHCLQIASQDARLYRMHLEGKVLTWLIDTWKVASGRARMAPYLVRDILQLLETICGFSKRADPLTWSSVPDCQIVDSVVEENKVKVIRDFVLYARLPPFGARGDDIKPSFRSTPAVENPVESPDVDLVGPRPKERKISSFLSRTLEALIVELETPQSHPRAETTRQHLDIAVTSALYQALLVANGVHHDRSVFQSAGKVLTACVESLTRNHWSWSEKLLVAQGLEPLLYDEDISDDGVFTEAMSQPGPDSGIKQQTLRRLLAHKSIDEGGAAPGRLALVQIVWQNVEMQDYLQSALSSMRNVLSHLLGAKPTDSRAPYADGDDRDGFGPIRTSVQDSGSAAREGDSGMCTRHLLKICISLATCGPFLQSPSSEPTRDKELLDMVIMTAAQKPAIFRLAFPILLHEIRRGVITISVKYIEKFLAELGELLRQYAFSKSPGFQRLVVGLLTLCLQVCKLRDGDARTVDHQFNTLSNWMFDVLKSKKFRSWGIRDDVGRFLLAYIVAFPAERPRISSGKHDTTIESLDDDLSEEEVAEDERENLKESLRGLGLPTRLILKLNKDIDVRVRFRAAVINAHLYSIITEEDFPAIRLYACMKLNYTRNEKDYEHMLTRMLSLGNIMITSSAVRRGPYWHLLETCGHSQLYPAYIESILRSVSERLGFASLSVIFESYASQIAYSMEQQVFDLSAFPPQLLGYRDKLQCAEASLRPFAPVTIWLPYSGKSMDDKSDIEKSKIEEKKQFEKLCGILGKTRKEGLQACFSDIVGYGISMLIAESTSDDIWVLLAKEMKLIDNFESAFHENVDSIIVMILRGLGDQNFYKTGEVAGELDRVNNNMSSAFVQLNVYRMSDMSALPILHRPNLPTYSAQVIIESLHWVSSHSSDGFGRATTFHVVQELMNTIHQTPLVNEQHRLITAMTMWLAYRVEDLDDMTILRVLLNGATLMFAQSDLVRSAQSLLEYSFKRYRSSKPRDPLSKTPTLPNVLLRICCSAQEYASSGDPLLVKTGKDLLAWVDRQLLLFAELPSFQGIVQKVLAAWPLPITEMHPLASLYTGITMHSLVSVLEDHHISSNKFRLVQRIYENALEYGQGDNNYAATYFWRLKECMPSSGLLQDGDIAAFIGLLYQNRGHIASFNPERPDLNSPRLRHRRLVKLHAASQDVKNLSNSQDAIMTGLLVMLEDTSAPFVAKAYRTLRLIFGALADGTPRSIPTLPSEYHTDVGSLKAYKRAPFRRPTVDVRNALRTDEYRTSTANFRQWISLITVLFSDALASVDSFYGQLHSMLNSHEGFAEEIMPILVQTLLQHEREKEKQSGVCGTLQATLSEYFEAVLQSKTTDIACIRAIVEMVLHLRYFAPRSTGTIDLLAYNKWLRIDYVLLAQSAILCGAYTTALLFVEIALEDPINNPTAVEQVLYEIYAHIDEPDGFYGIQTNDLQQFLVKRYHHERQWDKAFSFHGASLEAGKGGKAEAEGLVKSFHHFGFDHLAMDTLRNAAQDSSVTSPPISMNYQLGWRTETWDLPVQSMDSPGAPLYSSLRAIYRERDPLAIQDIVRSALSSEMDYLRSLGSENLAEIRIVSQELMSLREVLRWTDAAFQRELALDHDSEHCQDFLRVNPDFSFSDLECIMATRLSLIRSLRQKEERQQLGKFIPTAVRNLKTIEKHCLISLSEAAREANQPQVALNSVIKAQQLDDRPSFEVSEEFANVLWMQKEEPLAVRYLKTLVDNDDAGTSTPVEQSRKARWLSRLGTWAAEACMEKPSDISSKYFDRSIALLEDIKKANLFDSSLATIYRECAMFAERQYHTVCRSPDALRWKVYVERKRQEIELREKNIGSQTDNHARGRLQHEQTKAKKLLSEDTELFGKHNDLRDSLLKQAIEMHSRCLEASNAFDNDSVTRFCSLWFANFDDEFIAKTVETGLSRIPSRKLIMLAHQLTARVSTSPSSTIHTSQDNLQSTIIRMCQEHPFHILYQVYCISGHAASPSNGRRQSGRHSQESTQTERETAASDILDRLRNDKTTGQRLRDVQNLCDAYVEWAKFPITKDPKYKVKRKDTPFSIPKSLKILTIKDLRVPVTTVHTPLDPTLKYADCIWIDGYKSTFDTAGGINLPKISICMGSDGQNYKQLFKGEGNDDLRQDAVMEQVFELVNSLLAQDLQTRRRNLKVRDYKVIPLAKQAGILEFVGNTAPLRQWLNARHPAYRPKDLKPNEAQSRIAKVQKDYPGNFDLQIKTFIEVRERFKPVMRHYFTERHKTPIAWFQMRLRYTRSVATNSIVGHILGLGDRHTSNILLDNSTGEVVHIDLGIAFDQGKLLGVPEKVPFRMTADIVDGMGPTGTSGVFQRCAEETLRVLREESEVILTVLEVFKHDPLHSWTASDVRVKHAQGGDLPVAPVASPVAEASARAGTDIAFLFPRPIGIDMTSGSADEAADRALSSVARKLDKSLSVESTVSELLAEATDIANLATIFCGWGPHL